MEAALSNSQSTVDRLSEVVRRVAAEEVMPRVNDALGSQDVIASAAE